MAKTRKKAATKRAAAGKAAAKKSVKKPARKAVKKSAKRSAKKARPSPVPAGYHTVTPYLVVQGAAAAIDFYKQAFGAREKLRMAGPGGSIAHAELRIGDSMVMLGDEMPEMGASAPQTVGGSPVHVFLYVKNVDEWFARAVTAGATADMPPADMFWGDRYGKLTDPFGHKWSMATHIEDLTPREMARRGAAAMAPPPV